MMPTTVDCGLRYLLQFYNTEIMCNWLRAGIEEFLAIWQECNSYHHTNSYVCSSDYFVIAATYNNIPVENQR